MNLQENLRRLIIVFGIGILFFLLGDLNTRITELNQMKRDRAEVEARVNELARYNATLQAKVEYAKSDEIVAEWAYSENRMVQGNPNEYVVVVIPESRNLVEVAAAPPAALTPLENWQVWQQLFFSKP